MQQFSAFYRAAKASHPANDKELECGEHNGRRGQNLEGGLVTVAVPFERHDCAVYYRPLGSLMIPFTTSGREIPSERVSSPGVSAHAKCHLKRMEAARDDMR